MTWYQDLGIVSIGSQAGGPDDAGLGSLKIELWRALLARCTKSHSAAVDHYALALRISTTTVDFGGDGVEKIRRSRRERYIGADIAIPEARWRTFRKSEARAYLAQMVREAVCACLARLRRDGEPADDAALLAEVDAAIADFLGQK